MKLSKRKFRNYLKKRTYVSASFLRYKKTPFFRCIETGGLPLRGLLKRCYIYLCGNIETLFFTASQRFPSQTPFKLATGCQSSSRLNYYYKPPTYFCNVPSVDNFFFFFHLKAIAGLPYFCSIFSCPSFPASTKSSLVHTFFFAFIAIL